MHVVHLYDGHEQVYRGRGSVPSVVWNVARETVAAGHEVTLIERRWRDLDATAEHDGVRFERLSLRTGADDPWERVPYELVSSPVGLARLGVDRINFALSALRRLRDGEFDVVHVHLPFAAAVLITVAPWLRSRMVYTAHLGELRLNALSDAQRGTAPDGGTSTGRADGQFDAPRILTAVSPDLYLARRVAKTTVLNSDIERILIDRGVPPSALTVIPNGVDLERFRGVDPAVLDQVRATYDLDDVRVMSFVGTVMPRKGLDDFVHAVASLVRDRGFDDVRVVIAGEDELDGEYTARLRGLVREAGLDKHVTFVGFIPDRELPALYALTDVFVMPSLEEGFGMTVTEAMAAGTPVVATRVGGIPDQVDHGEHGLLVEPRAADELANALEQILRRESPRERMGRRARARAQRFSWQEICTRFTSVYQEVAR